MEEILKFIALLKRFRFVLMIVPVMVVIITFFLVRNLPNSYISQTQIATGIVDATSQNLLNQTTPQAQQVVQEFSNLMALMRLKKILDKVSYNLAIHDLTSSTPFVDKNKSLSTLDKGERSQALHILRRAYREELSLNVFNKDENKLSDLLKSLKYDSESLNSKLNIFRSGDSDFLIVQFESGDPLLSAYMVNTLSNEFVKYYTSLVKNNQVRTTNFLTDLLTKKNDTLARRMFDLRDYKIQNRVLNLDEQSKQLYTRIIEYDNKKQEAIQNTSSYAGALDEIDRKFLPQERQYLEASMSNLNSKIISKKEELSRLYDLYYQNDFDERYKSSIDSLQSDLNESILQSSDEYIVNPLSSKAALVQQKLSLEIQLDLSRYSINSLEKELTTLNRRFDQLVPKEAEVQSLEMKIEIATKEYLDVLTQYNQSSLEAGFQVKLKIVQPGTVGSPQPSKKMLLVILSSIIGFIFCMVAIFIGYLLDNSITSPKSLANKTDIPVLGTVNKLLSPSVELNNLWYNELSQISPLLLEFKDQLRSLRFEIEKELSDNILLISSIDGSEGKTMLALSLAFAWKMTGKRVLLIDGNFKNPDITASSNVKVYLEDVFKDGGEIEFSGESNNIDILSNKGQSTSLLEIASKEEIIKKLTHLKKLYGIVIIETSALADINQSKEWLLFAHNLVAVFSSGQAITESKKGYLSYLKESGSFKGWIFNNAISDFK